MPPASGHAFGCHEKIEKPKCPPQFSTGVAADSSLFAGTWRFGFAEAQPPFFQLKQANADFARVFRPSGPTA